MIDIHVPNAEAMRRVGRAIGEELLRLRDAPVVIGIEGELGAGKTTLAAGLLGVCGVAGPVRSPTYTLVEPYELPNRTIYHVDLYRVADPTEVEALAVRDMLSGAAALLIEWPSRATDVLPPADLELAIQYEGSGGRRLFATARTQLGDKLVRAIVAVAPELRSVSS